MVARDHHNANALAPQALESGGCTRLNRVRYCNYAGLAAVDRDEHRRRALRSQRLGVGFDRGERNIELRKKRGIPDRDCPSIHRSGHPLAGDRAELRSLGKGQVTVARGREDSRGERVLARPFGARGCGEYGFLLAPVITVSEARSY